jgi:hypothetical protein
MARTTKTQREAMFQALAAGITEDFAATDTFWVTGREYTRDELAGLFQACVAASARTHDAKVAWLIAAKEEAELHRKAEALRQGVKLVFESRLGRRNPSLRRYGMQPRRPGRKTLAVKVRAAARSLETRADRGTTGKRPRRKLRG